MRFHNSSAILPLGKINLTTGKSKYFNVYETWGEDTTYEIHRTTDGKLKIVATSGTVPIAKMNKSHSFRHDQTNSRLFDATMIDSAVGSKLKDLVAKYGNSISGYTYK